MNGEFWDDLGRRVTGAVDILEKKTDEVAQLTRLKSRQYAAERELKERYETVGRLVCEQYQAGLPADGNTNIVEACEKAAEKEKELKEILNQVNLSRS